MRLLAVMLLLLLGQTLSSQTPPSSLKTTWDQTKSSAKLDEVKGQVLIITDKVEPGSAAQINQPLLEGMEIRTGIESTALISFSDGSKVEFSENGKYRIDKISPTKISIFVTLGTIHSWVSRQPGRDFEVKTPTSVSNVRGTEFTVTVDGSGKTTLTVMDGSVTFTDSTGNKTTLTGGQSISTTPREPSIAQTLLREAINKLNEQLQRNDLTAEERDRFEKGLAALNQLSDRLATTSDQPLIDAINNRATDILENLGPDFSDLDLANLNNLVDIESAFHPTNTPQVDPTMISSAATGVANPPPAPPPENPVETPSVCCASTTPPDTQPCKNC